MKFLKMQLSLPKTWANNIFQVEIRPDQKDKDWLLLVHCLYANDDAKGQIKSCVEVRKLMNLFFLNLIFLDWCMVN